MNRSNRVGSPVYSNSKYIKSWRVDGAYAASFGSSSSGVPNPGTFRGGSLSSVSILWRSAWVISEKSVPFWIVETHQAVVVLNSTFFPAVVRGVKIALRSQFRSDFLVLGKLKAIVKSDRVHLIPREQLDSLTVRCQLRFNSRLTVLCDVPMVSAMSSCFSPRCFIR